MRAREAVVRVVKERDGGVVRRVRLVDGDGQPVAAACRFLDHLVDRGFSPHTICAYGYDLRRLFTFLAAEGMDWREFRGPDALRLLAFLRREPSRRPAQRLGLTVVVGGPEAPGSLLVPATVNRILAAVSSFYDWAVVAEEYDGDSPMQMRLDPALARVPDRRQPFMGRASRQQPMRRTVTVKQPRRLPRPVDAADALRSLIETAKAGNAAARHDAWAQRPVRYVFVRRGKPMGRQFLFTDSLEIACRKAGLVDGDGNPTVTAHRFRHTVGTQLAEGGAQIQTIMAILGHRNAQMSATYSHISDPVLKDQYEKVIAAGGRIAGPAAEELLSSRIGKDTLNWLKTNFFKTELELGHCLRAPAEGPCECDLYLRCSKFLTTSEYAPRLRTRLSREQQLAQDAIERGWPREVERHNAIADRIRSLLADLGESPEPAPGDHR
ncbi:tyrosine-type recombinase/integrase [Kitasatospora sp. NPDC048545]|uniref:tyrosine-type recombinase/integrase n=1 Tax=Kitasatospora sp. NPDC048545 TaxID=3157208 RepID=UPI0033EE5072